MIRTAVSEAERQAGDGLFVIEFVSVYCTLTTSTVAGTRGDALVLRQWQKDLILDLYARDVTTGKRKFKMAYVGMPRKNGKSALAACLVLYEIFCGIAGSEVYSVAGARHQAKIVYDIAKQMILADGELASKATVLQSALESDGSVYRAIASDSDNAEGLNPNLVVFDEVHTQPNWRLWNTMRLGSGARAEPLLLGITTAGVRTDTTGDDTLAYSLYEHGKAVVAGEVDDPTFFFCWWEPSALDCDHTSPDVWSQANPGYGDLNNPDDFASACLATPEPEFRTKRLNQWVDAYSNRWLPAGQWEARADAERVVDASEPVVLGFDGSWANDSTGLVGATLTGHVFLIDVWEKPADAAPGWRVRISDVEQAIRNACARYNVLEVVCDPYRWARSIQALEDEGYPMVEFPTNIPTRMIPATSRFTDAVAEGTITHDGNSRLAAHIDNAVLKNSPAGSAVTKKAASSKRKIDLAICAVIAFERASQVLPPKTNTLTYY